MLKYFYITNNTSVAKIAQNAGVDRIFVDMEYIGKEERQPNMNTVKNHHTVDDVIAVRKVIDKAELMVRVNPIHDNSKQEIDSVIDAGADVIMLPMWKKPREVEEFVSIVNARATTMLLLETDEARGCLDDVLKINGIDEIHIGLNDLHLSQGKKFLFELTVDGTVDEIANKIKAKGIPFGFGGVGRVFQGDMLPAENILAEHYRLGSSMVILSRAFCNTYGDNDLNSVNNYFIDGVNANREYEKELQSKDMQFFINEHKKTTEIIKQIVSEK
ncbi:MAG: aldolase/citrate lyase family protein [Eubacterium sp.]